MTPTTPLGGAAHRHPRSIVGVVLAFLGAIVLTIGVASSPAAGLTAGPAANDLPCEDDPYCDPCDDPYSQECDPCDDPYDPYCDPCDDPYDPYCYPTTTVPATTTTTTTTTVPESTTTTTTTTTVPETSTTVEATTTTTTTTTTMPETTTTFEVEGPTTTTTLPCEWDPELPPDDPNCYQGTTTSVEVAPPTTTGTGSNSPTTVAAELPKTGPGTTDTMLVLGALLLLVGGAMVLSTRRADSIA